MDADLIFPETGSPQGFSSLAMAQWDGKPEPIVRELLQNCLDAAREAERERAEVCFTIDERPLADLPGIDAYRAAFAAAREERERPGETQSAGEKRAIEGIHGVLERERVRLLFCRDNGIGLSDGLLDRVLTEGNTGKAAGGGAFGVGHLTAFAGSDLRYVLYAGRSRANGTLRDAVSGHAVLASHRSSDDPDTGIGGDGYLLRPGQQSLFAQRDKYPDTAPPLLADEMARIGDTGSVVCIAGFNDFRDDPAKAVRSLRRVAATHFLAAIALDGMVVHVCDADGKESVVDRAALEGILGHVSIRDQRRRDGGALVPGQQVWRAWQCFESGRELPASGVEGVTIRIRPRMENEGYDSRVQLYRDGMWITNEAPHLRVNDFGGFQPFDAVVLVEEGELYGLVRDAEGPEHLGLDRERIIVKGGGRFPVEALARTAGRCPRPSAWGRGRARARPCLHADQFRHRSWGALADGGAPAPLSPASRRQHRGRCHRSADRRGGRLPRRPEPRTAPEAGPPAPPGTQTRQRRSRALLGLAAAQCEGRVRYPAGRLADDRAGERAEYGGRARARAVGFGLDLREPPGPAVAGTAGHRASRGNGPRQRAGRDRAGRAPGGWNAHHHAGRTDYGSERGRGRRRAAQARRRW